MKAINCIRKYTDRIIPTVSAIFFLVCVLATAYGTINRTLGLNLNASWVEEVSISSMIWSTMILLGHLFRIGMHTQFTLFTDKMHGRFLSSWRIMIIIIEFALFVIIFLGGIKFAGNGSKIFMSALHIKMIWTYISVPIGAGIVLLELSTMLVEEVLNLSGAAEEGK